MRKILVIAVAGAAVAVAFLVGSAHVLRGIQRERGFRADDAAKRRPWEIDQLEKNFHKATTKKDIDLMASLFAPERHVDGPRDDRRR